MDKPTIRMEHSIQMRVNNIFNVKYKIIVCVSLLFFINPIFAQAEDVTLCSDAIGGYCFGVIPGTGKKIAENLYRFKTDRKMFVDVNCSSLLFRVAIPKTKQTIDSNGNVISSNDVIETSSFAIETYVPKDTLKSLCAKKK